LFAVKEAAVEDVRLQRKKESLKQSSVAVEGVSALLFACF